MWILNRTKSQLTLWLAAGWPLDKPVVCLWKDRSRREGGPPPVSPHEVLQLPELVLQLHLSLGQGLHYGGIIGPDMWDGAGVQIVRA